jgi:hypothetical protein
MARLRLDDAEESFVESLSAYSWAASWSKSGASFISNDRFVIKCISRTELQMFRLRSSLLSI